MNFIQILLALLQLAPSILQTVQTVETVVTGPKQGPAKKAVVMAAVTGSGAPLPLASAVSTFVDASVAILNRAGALSAPADAAAVQGSTAR